MSIPDVLSLVSQPLQGSRATMSTLPLNVSQIGSPLNLSMPSTNLSANGNALTIACTARLGLHLSQLSCYDVLTLIPASMTMFSFGQRGTGDFDTLLPARFISGR